MGVHDGHRSRMKARFLKHGLENFDDHNILELLLFFSVPRGDVNPLAHAMLDRFGNISAVFDAPIEELMRVPGVGENTAALVKLVPQICRRYMMSRTNMDCILDSSSRTGAFLIPRFYGEREEVVYLTCLDAKRKVLACTFMGRGSVNSANVSIRKIVETALLYNATGAILAHNHTSGIALPSMDDEEVTHRVQDALASVEVELVDHIIIADDDFVSMADNGFFNSKTR